MALRLGLGLGLSGGVSFSPLSLFAASEPGFLYDPSDISTLFQDAAGTTPVTAAGQSVGLVLDKSGRGNHATQSTSLSRPTYQVDSNGRGHLLFDGSDDFLVTPTITPGTDKAQVFAGISKLSDTAAVFLETSLNVATYAGSLYVVTGADAHPSYRYSTTARGTAAPSASMIAYNITANAPETVILSAFSDIAAPLSRVCRNGVKGTDSTVSKGTGNFLAYPVYIGRRGGTSLPFNGRIYSLICRFGANLPTSTIEQTEAWVNSKTGAY